MKKRWPIKLRYGFIGCGNLAQALILGALQRKIIKPSQIFVTSRDYKKIKSFVSKAQINFVADKSELVEKCDIIFLATKPQDILTPLKEMSQLVDGKKVIVCLAAGVDSIILKSFLHHAGGIIRVMANTPAAIQKGVFGVQIVRDHPKLSLEVMRLFETLGSVVVVKKDHEIDAITAGSASGVGFVLMFMEEFEKWFISKGLSGAAARQASIETFLGASSLAQTRHGESLRALREKVTSKKGTTLAGLNRMRKSKISLGLRAGLEAAYLRSQELTRSLSKSKK